MEDLGVETWLMHSTLLGWWRDKRVLPGDLNISVQVSELGIFFLAAYYNMSTFYFKNPDLPNGRKYLLQLSRHARDRDPPEGLDPVDARWTDIETGLSIDVYAVRYNLTHPGGEGMLSCKDGSEIRDTYLFPLQKTTFEGVPARIPYRSRELLVAEYGVTALDEAGQE
ncbi:uncharacterized protein THITE_2121977 [Thermothielavioides terrestris NRRL 8126]|uniref:LicD/FKTN/FKRP nucleotidyltransferase domain-containing protein n=1 Tax=Thermothielavioides terrestris (strain ATCC 38088 / NRRL 8126) TaxID=578455 RepID=G2RFJ3_THETT|nr:uncharacterized protein THITE_2121977 [Thermothielavioides terrestris NRRL 8126]AEO70476.1 hypothetical protein THITE_2121977 [Thermothielavioides terrestris NRRL 8126]